MRGLADVNEDIISGVEPPVRVASLEDHGPRSESNLQRKKKADVRSFRSHDSGLGEWEVMSLVTEEEEWVIGWTLESRTAKRLWHWGRKEGTWNQEGKSGAMDVREPNREWGERVNGGGGNKRRREKEGSRPSRFWRGRRCEEYFPTPAEKILSPKSYLCSYKIK